MIPTLSSWTTRISSVVATYQGEAKGKYSGGTVWLMTGKSCSYSLRKELELCDFFHFYFLGLLSSDSLTTPIILFRCLVFQLDTSSMER